MTPPSDTSTPEHTFKKGERVTVIHRETGVVERVTTIKAVNKTSLREPGGGLWALDGGAWNVYRREPVGREYSTCVLRPFEPGDDAKAERRALMRRCVGLRWDDLAAVPTNILLSLVAHLPPEKKP